MKHAIRRRLHRWRGNPQLKESERRFVGLQLSAIYLTISPVVGLSTNCRINIHHVLSSQHCTPKDIIFPVSAAILRNIKEYDAALESTRTRFSRTSNTR